MSANTLRARASQPPAKSFPFDAEAVQFEPIVEDGVYHGMLVRSPLERVALFSWRRIDLSLSDITRLRHALVRFQARRAVLYVPSEMLIASSLVLLATLSKIAIVREEPVAM